MRSVFYLTMAAVLACITVGCDDEKKPEKKVKVRAPFVHIETNAPPQTAKAETKIVAKLFTDSAPPQTIVMPQVKEAEEIVATTTCPLKSKIDTQTCKRKCERSVLVKSTCRPKGQIVQTCRNSVKRATCSITRVNRCSRSFIGGLF